mmetsp:Transcript_11299/g.26591  ORF Transcript_11299/g.26591 Transcript_11299/m.26591 type:complete len:619 (+) Transcript_11299:60-1916(+)
MDEEGNPVQACALLKFLEGGGPVLDPAGLDLVSSVDGLLCPFVFLGDGRAGKSFLASALLGQAGVFVSSDSSQSVTEGIDVAVGPANESGEHVLVMDCEGGNNALAEIHSLVNVFALVACTHVVFVANSMASEAALECLESAVASQSVMQATEGSGIRPPQRLTFVVNKTTLRYGDDTLEKLLGSNVAGEGVSVRNEMRRDIKAAFPERRFIAVPHNALPGHADSMDAFKTELYDARRPLLVGGMAVRGKQLCKIFELITQEMRELSAVRAPSVARAVVFDGFLRPLADKLLACAQGGMPELMDYDPDMAQKDPLLKALADFDAAASHVAPGPLLDEARELLRTGISTSWHELWRKNEALGEELSQLTTETRQVVESERTRQLGGTSLLKHLVVTQQTIRVESRVVGQNRKGGAVSMKWTLSGHQSVLREGELEEKLSRLGQMTGRLARRQKPAPLGPLLGIHSFELCFCVIQDLHLIWWLLPYTSDKPTRCFNLLERQCNVSQASPDSEAAFVVNFEKDPTLSDGGDAETLWFQVREPASFSSTFSCCISPSRAAGTFSATDVARDRRARDKWVSCLEQHDAVARSVSKTLARRPHVVTPTLRDIRNLGPSDRRAQA